MSVVTGLSPQTDPPGQPFHPFPDAAIATTTGTVEQAWINALTITDAAGNQLFESPGELIGNGVTGPDTVAGKFAITAGSDSAVASELRGIVCNLPTNAASVTFSINVDWIDPNAPGAATQPWLEQQTEIDQETVSFSASTGAAGGTPAPPPPPPVVVPAAPPPDVPIAPSPPPATSPIPVPSSPSASPSPAQAVTPAISPNTPVAVPSTPQPASTLPVPTPHAADPPGFAIADLTTGTATDPTGNSLQLTGADDYMVTAMVPSALIVADSGPLNFITEAGGANATFLSASAPVSWNTISGFHAGDFAFIAGVTPQTLRDVPNQGVPGLQGLTFETFQHGGAAFLTLAGLQDTSHLAIGFGNGGMLIVGT